MFVPVGRRAVPGRFISIPFPTRQQRLSPGVCPDCINEYSYCECEPGPIDLAAIQWEPAIGIITELDDLPF